MARKGKPMRPDVQIGERCGARTVIGMAEAFADGRKKWIVMCDCGRIDEIGTSGFRCGSACHSCGARKSGKARFKHGEAARPRRGVMRRATRLYEIWQKMRNRCNNPSSRQWKWYGGKGVKLCEAWNDYCAFRDWALANGYTDELTIERRRSEIGYSPDNCEWITRSQNSFRARIPSMAATIWNGTLSFGA